MQIEFKVGQRVVANNTITESGLLPGSPKAEFPAPDYIHALKNDEGMVESINGDGYPTVRFGRTGTSTIVSHTEITIF